MIQIQTLVGLLTAAVLVSPVAAAPPDPQIAHGARLASRCDGCHAIGAVDQSRNSDAPPFRELARRRNPAALELALKRIAKHGHMRMRPTGMSDAESQDLAAYIAHLDTMR